MINDALKLSVYSYRSCSYDHETTINKRFISIQSEASECEQNGIFKCSHVFFFFLFIYQFIIGISPVLPDKVHGSE